MLMKKSKNLRLENLKVKSFKTVDDKKTLAIKGGSVNISCVVECFDPWG